MYKILILATTVNEVDYYNFVLDDSEEVYSVETLEEVQTKMEDLLGDYEADQLVIVKSVTYTVDVTATES